jgi:hypothetical protein
MKLLAVSVSAGVVKESVFSEFTGLCGAEHFTTRDEAADGRAGRGPDADADDENVRILKEDTNEGVHG